MITIWTDREGNKLTFSEFLSRWKEGISGISPEQKIGSQIWGTRIILLGLFLGLFVTVYAWKNMWWVTIILTGAIINTTVQYIGLVQQRNLFKDIEKQLNYTEEVQNGKKSTD